ncbi:MAG: UbiA family prenyltransferase [Candidatus Diapherotrites archaeon]
MSLRDYIKIIRPFNCLIAAFGAFLGFSLSMNSFYFDLPLLYSMLAVFFVCAGGQAINDFFDVEIDRIIKRHRPLPRKAVGYFNSLVYSIALFLVGIGFSYFIGSLHFWLAVFFALLLIFYSAFLGRFKFIGNYVIAFSVAFTIIYGGLLGESLCLPVILAISAFLANLGREITKDLEDLKGDRGLKTSLGSFFSLRPLAFFALFLYLLAVAVGFYPFVAGIFFNFYYFFLMVASFLLFVWAFRLLLEKEFRSSQLYSKLGMLAGMIAFLVALI